jgi:hypothetical protein
VESTPIGEPRRTFRVFERSSDSYHFSNTDRVKQVFLEEAGFHDLADKLNPEYTKAVLKEFVDGEGRFNMDGVPDEDNSSENQEQTPEPQYIPQESNSPQNQEQVSESPTSEGSEGSSPQNQEQVSESPTSEGSEGSSSQNQE